MNRESWEWNERALSVEPLSSEVPSRATSHRPKPLGLEAAVKAIETQTGRTSAAQRQLELSLQQARYEVAHARRQYDAVDPANRLVAAELERRWNDALQTVHRIECEIASIVAIRPPPLGERERQELMRLGADLERAWSIQPPQLPRASASCARRSTRSWCARRGQSSIWFCTGRAETTLHYRSS